METNSGCRILIDLGRHSSSQVKEPRKKETAVHATQNPEMERERSDTKDANKQFYDDSGFTGGGLLRKPMNQPLNGVAEIPQALARNLWSWISPAIELVGPWNLRIRVPYIPNYKTAISYKIACWEGEQFALKSGNIGNMRM